MCTACCYASSLSSTVGEKRCAALITPRFITSQRRRRAAAATSSGGEQRRRWARAPNNPLRSALINEWHSAQVGTNFASNLILGKRINAFFLSLLNMSQETHTRSKSLICLNVVSRSIRPSSFSFATSQRNAMPVTMKLPQYVLVFEAFEDAAMHLTEFRAFQAFNGIRRAVVQIASL